MVRAPFATPASYRPLKVIKAADETISSDDTMSADAELTLTLPPGNYLLLIYIGYVSGTTPDYKFDVDVPADAVLNLEAFNYTTSLGLSIAGAFGDVFPISAGGAGAIDLAILIQGALTIVTAGSVTYRWAQNTSTASNTTTYAGSIMVAFPLP